MTISTSISSPTLETYGVTMDLDHFRYEKAHFYFRPHICPGVEPDWRQSEMTVELVNRITKLPEIHVFRPVDKWTGDQMRDWVHLKQKILPPQFRIEEAFARAVLDLVM